MRAVAYLVVRGGGRPRIVRVTQRRPWLEADEAMIRVALDLPDDLFEAPVVVVPVTKEEVAVAVSIEEATEE